MLLCFSLIKFIQKQPEISAAFPFNRSNEDFRLLLAKSALRFHGLAVNRNRFEGEIIVFVAVVVFDNGRHIV